MTNALVVRHGAKRSAVPGDATSAGAFVAYYKHVLQRRNAKRQLTRPSLVFRISSSHMHHDFLEIVLPVSWPNTFLSRRFRFGREPTVEGFHLLSERLQ